MNKILVYHENGEIYRITEEEFRKLRDSVEDTDVLEIPKLEK